MKYPKLLLIFILTLNCCETPVDLIDDSSDSKEKCTTIFETILNCDLQKLKEQVSADKTLVNKGDTSNHLYTPLFYAAQINDLEKFNYLLNNGANIHSITDKYIIPRLDVLYIALEYDSDKILNKLIELNEFDLNKKYNDCENAIYTAVRNNSIKCLKILLERNVNIDVIDECEGDEGLSPLAWAALENSVEAADLLIQHGASVHDKRSGFTILDEACLSTNCSVDMVKLLIENGVRIEETNSENFTPLMKVTRQGKTDVIKYLLSKGANINATTKTSNSTPLHIACESNNLETIELLIINGANPDALDSKGLKPIELLESPKDVKIMLNLIQKSA